MKNKINLFEIEPAFKSKVFVKGENYSLKYKDVIADISTVRGWFKQNDLSKGDRIIICSRNEPVAIELFLAAITYGLIPAILEEDSKPANISEVTNLVKPKMVFTDEYIELEQAVKQYSVKLKQKSKGSLLNKLKGNNVGVLPDFIEGNDTCEIVHSEESETAYLIFTSGTTSMSKAVEVTYGAMFDHLKTVSEVFAYNSKTRLMNTLPLSHTDGLFGGVLMALYNRFTLYRDIDFTIQDTNLYLDMLYKNVITHLLAVPSLLKMLLKYGFENKSAFEYPEFKFVISTASALQVDLWNEFQQYFGVKICNMYGLSETTDGGLFCGPQNDTFKIGTVGKPIDCEIKIVDENKELVDIETVGELCIKGSLVMKGYFDNPEGTGEVLNDGWFFTGDLASVDESGFVTIRGRKKQVIIRGGFNIYPEEINKVVENMADVVEAVTVGVPDDIWGEKVLTFVSYKNAKPGVDDIKIHCNKLLPSNMVPNEFVVLDKLFYTSSGKPNSNKLLKHYHNINNSLSKNDDLEASILNIAAKCFGIKVKDISLSDSKDTIGSWDSIRYLELIAETEEQLNVEFTAMDIINVNRISDLLAIVKQKLK